MAATGEGRPPKRLKGNGSEKVDPTAALPWVEKYRPSSLSDMIAHEEIISTSKRCFLNLVDLIRSSKQVD